MIAIALVIAAVAYMYRDLEKTKSELSSFKNSLRPQPSQISAQPQSASAPVKRETDEKAIAEDEVSD